MQKSQKRAPKPPAKQPRRHNAASKSDKSDKSDRSAKSNKSAKLAQSAKSAKSASRAASAFDRPSWDEYFLKLAMLASERATCPRMHCGCVLVRDRYVLATGYNGSLPGHPHCDDVGCLIVDNHCVRTVHAELNALAQATRHGVSLEGATAYVTNMPCTTCAKSLIAAGVRRVVVFSDYHKTLAVDFFAQSGVELVKLPMPERMIRYDLASYSSARKSSPPDTCA